MKRNAFSMIELVFVIVILGVLSAISVPRFIASRADAEVAAIRNDIATILKTIPMNIFAQNIEISGMPPSNFSISGVRNATWGHWIVDTVGLDKSRWKVSSNGVEPIYKKASNPNNSLGCGIVILIIPTSANKPAHISFDPELFEKGPGAKHALCKGLRAAYPKGSKRIIPLEDTGRIKF